MTTHRSLSVKNRRSSKRTVKPAIASRSRSADFVGNRNERKRPRTWHQSPSGFSATVLPSLVISNSEVQPAPTPASKNSHCDTEGPGAAQVRRETITHALGRELDEWCKLNESRNKYQLPSPTDPFSIFYSKQKPKFSISVYVSRLVHYIDASESVFYTALLYMSRVQSKQSRLAIGELNVHRLLTTCVVLASKFLEDNVYTNKHYAQAGGLTGTEEMNGLERSILQILDFNLNVSPDVYSLVQHHLARTECNSAIVSGELPFSQKSPTSIHVEKAASFADISS